MLLKAHANWQSSYQGIIREFASNVDSPKLPGLNYPLGAHLLLPTGRTGHLNSCWNNCCELLQSC